MTPPDFLDTMKRQSEERTEAARALRDFEQLWDAALDAPAPRSINHSIFDIIAEIKASSPSEGVLRATSPDTAIEEAVAQARLYEAAGAAAISVLTEPTKFGGSLDHLRAVAAAVSIPVMRKDFLTADYQVVEAREAGASGVLLIARMLSDDDLFEMTDLARDLGMFCLIEAFDGSDLSRVNRLVVLRGHEFARGDHVGRLYMGLNSRDLATLKIDPTQFEVLKQFIPTGFPSVAESGINTPDDAARVARLGYNLALVGSSLMKAKDPQSLAAAMIQAGRTQ